MDTEPEPNSPWVVGVRFAKKYSVVRSFADRSGVMAVYGPVATEQLAKELLDHLKGVFDMHDLLEVIPIYEAIA